MTLRRILPEKTRSARLYFPRVLDTVARHLAGNIYAPAADVSHPSVPQVCRRSLHGYTAGSGAKVQRVVNSVSKLHVNGTQFHSSSGVGSEILRRQYGAAVLLQPRVGRVNSKATPFYMAVVTENRLVPSPGTTTTLKGTYCLFPPLSVTVPWTIPVSTSFSTCPPLR